MQSDSERELRTRFHLPENTPTKLCTKPHFLALPLAVLLACAASIAAPKTPRPRFGTQCPRIAQKGVRPLPLPLGREDLSLHALRLHQVVDSKTFDHSEEHSSIKFNSTIPASELEPDAEMKRLAEAEQVRPTSTTLAQQTEPE